MYRQKKRMPFLKTESNILSTVHFKGSLWQRHVLNFMFTVVLKQDITLSFILLFCIIKALCLGQVTKAQQAKVNIALQMSRAKGPKFYPTPESRGSVLGR